jgi:dihydroorotate dehydrogenase electron transfer subunit
MNRIVDIQGIIVGNEPVIKGHYRIDIELPEPLGEVRPGQFVMLEVPSAEIFLRRPFSIYDAEENIVSVLYRVAGKGTAELSRATAGAGVMVLGPLGNGFSPADDRHPVILSGGIGVAGIHLLWKKLREKASFFWGCASSAEMKLIDALHLHNPFISTMDGSSGRKGTVIDLMKQHLDELPEPFEIFTCGPEPMYVALREHFAENRVPCHVLVEERMACGLGLCFGCVKKTVDEKEPYHRVCKEGPVFDLWQISL